MSLPDAPTKQPEVCDMTGPGQPQSSVGTVLSGYSRAIRVGHCVTRAGTWEDHPCQL